MGDELVELLEGAGVEERVDALARRELALFLLTAKAIFAEAPSNGAKPTNHECDGAPATSAVPVFPAMRSG